MHTYFIYNEIAGHVKIGRSKRPQGRLRELQTSISVPLRLLGVVERDIEGALHRQLAAHRLSGEWFDWVEEVREVARMHGMKDIPPALEPTRKPHMRPNQKPPKEDKYLVAAERLTGGIPVSPEDCNSAIYILESWGFERCLNLMKEVALDVSALPGSEDEHMISEWWREDYGDRSMSDSLRAYDSDAKVDIELSADLAQFVQERLLGDADLCFDGTCPFLCAQFSDELWAKFHIGWAVAKETESTAETHYIFMHKPKLMSDQRVLHELFNDIEDWLDPQGVPHVRVWWWEKNAFVEHWGINWDEKLQYDAWASILS